MSEVVDTFLNAGFSKDEASKVIDFWMKAKINPFSKTEISKKIDDLFLFFGEFFNRTSTFFLSSSLLSLLSRFLIR